MAKWFNLISEIAKSEESVKLDSAQLTTGADYFQKLNVPAIYTGAWTPSGTSTVPGKAGDIYVDTTNSKIYVAKAATGASDFLILN